jgi:hypothetical protein
MRRIFSVLVVVALAFVLAGTTQAATFVPGESSLTLNLGSIFTGGPNAAPGTEAMVSLVDNGAGGHDIVMQPSVWSTVNYSGGTALWTGIPLISDALITVKNKAMTVTDGFQYTNYLSGTTGVHNVIGPAMGYDSSPLSGQLLLSILKGVVYVKFDLVPIGGPAGGTQLATALGVEIPVTNGPYFTGPVPITGITTNVLSWNGVTGAGITLHLTPEQHAPVLSTGGGYVATGEGLPIEYHTVTIEGTNDLLSANEGGFIMIPSPMRIDTTPAISGRVPGASWWRLKFVPEPGTMLLLVAGAAGLVVVGR